MCNLKCVSGHAHLRPSNREHSVLKARKARYQKTLTPPPVSEVSTPPMVRHLIHGGDYHHYLELMLHRRTRWIDDHR